MECQDAAGTGAQPPPQGILEDALGPAASPRAFLFLCEAAGTPPAEHRGSAAWFQPFSFCFISSLEKGQKVTLVPSVATLQHTHSPAVSTGQGEVDGTWHWVSGAPSAALGLDPAPHWWQMT